MGEPHPGQATASDCQLLTEQPGKDLQTMGVYSEIYMCTASGVPDSVWVGRYEHSDEH